MTQEHLNAFVADVRRINQNIRLDRPTGCFSCFKTPSSLTGLVEYLDHNVLRPRAMSIYTAKQHCDNPNDLRLEKYRPALERLTSVWGRGNFRRYPNQPGFSFVPQHLRCRADFNFRQNIARLPLILRPQYRDIVNYDQDPFLFNRSLGAAFLHRYQGDNGNVDITARGLLLKVGLGVPEHTQRDRGYIDALQLSNDDLNRMYRTRILDAGCGAAIFRSEMAIHYGAETTGLDLNPDQITNAIPQGIRRYVKSILYLKMLKDMNALQRLDLPNNAGPMIDRLFLRINEVIAHYGDQNNLPVRGNIFNINPIAMGNRHGSWHHTVCLNVLGYFTAEQQTEIMLNLCAVTRNKVFVYSGSGALRNLVYDKNTITNTYPNAQIIEKSRKLHHIEMG